jgi:hypothetical protein
VTKQGNTMNKELKEEINESIRILIDKINNQQELNKQEILTDLVVILNKLV